MAEAEVASPAGAGDEVKPYKIHVSSKYLELTRQKLELTRLPHEAGEHGSEDWWEPKPQVETLIDFWLEKYSWRDQELHFNELPQFRTAIPVPPAQAPLRIHFLHFRSPHANAVPLLVLPSFPFTNLSLSHLGRLFTDPEDVENNQPFHLVVPALPGLGFSDPLPNNVSPIPTTAEMLNTLMSRLSYDHYLATNSGPASSSPAEVDWRLAKYLSTHYTSSCLGTHLISPPLATPKIQEDPWEWTKWSVASFFRAGILGYSDDDFSALERANFSYWNNPSSSGKTGLTPTQIGLNKFGLKEPNTLAYGLCDSPTGLLVFVLKGLRLLSPRINFTPEATITLTQLAWLPGPEYAMRFWAHCATHREVEEDSGKEKKAGGGKPRVAITVFLGGAGGGGEAIGGTAADGTGQIPGLEQDKEQYVCPTWGNTRYNVVFSQRRPGKPGLLAWERPEIIALGVRGLAKEIMRTDTRLQVAAEMATAPLEQVVAAEAGQETASAGKRPTLPGATQTGESSNPMGGGTFSDEESPDTIVVTTPPLGATP